MFLLLLVNFVYSYDSGWTAVCRLYLNQEEVDSETDYGNIEGYDEYMVCGCGGYMGIFVCGDENLRGSK
jgi:hypothetical protein